MNDDSVEVWVELPIELGSSKAKTLAPGTVRKVSLINNLQATMFRRGWCSREAYLAADLMKKAAESRAAAETAVNVTSSKAKDKGGKTLQRKKSIPLEVEEDVFVPVQLVGASYELKEASEAMMDFIDKDIPERIEVNVKNIFPCNTDTLIRACSDLTGLNYMEEANILYSLYIRYNTAQIYTNVASILLAINPYQELPIYDKHSMMSYRSTSATGKTQGTAPHVFSVAEEAYANICAPLSLKKKTLPKNQSMIVCGESGSGKTESAKHLMRYLANRAYDLSRANLHDVSQQSEVERQVIEANTILESIGNANTLLNHNSSRFGKFTKLFIMTAAVAKDDQKEDVGKVIGAATDTYLLEKSRVVRQNRGERNFHIFYSSLKGFSSEQREMYRLNALMPKDFHYCNQGGIFSVSGIDDIDWFKNFCNALTILKVADELQEQFFGILTGILHIGNVVYDTDGTTDDGCVVSEDTRFHLEAAAHVMGLNAADLEKRLTTANVKVVRETIAKKLNPRDAAVNRDSISKGLYDDLFNWTVYRINFALSEAGSGFPWIGILDVFGFESFENNSFEQFCINFANERLQQHFNYSILLSEQKEYALEGILWEPLDVADHQDTIELISQATKGVLPLLDSACKLKSATPDVFVKSLFDMHKQHPRLMQVPKTGAPKHLKHGMAFVVEHYAGPVIYNAEEFLSKNTDSTDPDTAKLFKSSQYTVVQEVVMSPDERDTGKSKPTSPEAKELGKTKKGITVKSTFSSVSGNFSSQLSQLVETLEVTQSYFIRCVKPNTLKKKGIYDPIKVRPQLKCGGLVEAVKMLKRGFPTRVSFDEIYKQYSPLLNPQPVFELNKRDFSQAVLALFNLQRSEYQLGLTKVFFKAGRRALLESVMNRDSKLSPEDMEILMGFLMKKRWQRTIATVNAISLLSFRVKQMRAVTMWFRTAKVGVVYRKTFHKLMKKVQKRRREGAAFVLQAALKSVVTSFKTKKGIENMRLERIRAEEARKRKEEEERLKQELANKKKEEREAWEAAERERKEKSKAELERKRKERDEELKRLEEEAAAKKAAASAVKKEETPITTQAAMASPAVSTTAAPAPAAGTAVTQEQLQVMMQQMMAQMMGMQMGMAGPMTPTPPVGKTMGGTIRAPDSSTFEDGVSSPASPEYYLSMPIPPEEEIQHWVEELLGIKLDCSLFMAIEDGAVRFFS
jgi:myosin heavy subunit